MVNYEDGKIYKVVCNTSGLSFIGATTEKQLSRRLATHRMAVKQQKQNLLYLPLLNKVFENNDCKIILIEKYPCNDRMELERRLQYHIDLLPCVNKASSTSSSLHRDETSPHVSTSLYPVDTMNFKG